MQTVSNFEKTTRTDRQYSFDEYQDRTKNNKKYKNKHDRANKRQQKRNFEY